MLLGRMPKEARAAVLKRQAKAEVTIVRISAGTLDDDNFIAACKALRDGIADGIGVKDNDPCIEFWYEQRRGRRKQYDVHIEIRMRPA